MASRATAPAALGSAEDFQRLRFGGAEGLLDDDVLVIGDTGKGPARSEVR